MFCLHTSMICFTSCHMHTQKKHSWGPKVDIHVLIDSMCGLEGVYKVKQIYVACVKHGGYK